MTARGPAPRRFASGSRVLACAVAAVLCILAACGGSPPAGSAGTTGSAPAAAPPGASGVTSGGGPGPGGTGSQAGTLPASPGPVASSSPGTAGPAWVAVPVEQPPALIEPYPSGNAPVFCSPCHSADQTNMTGVARAPGGTLVAAGWSLPGPRAATWVSAGGAAWRRTPLTGPDGSLLTAVATTGAGFVAVGGSGAAAAAWTSPDGTSWAPATVPGPPAATSERMTSVVAWRHGAIASGYAEGAAGRQPVAWLTADGSRWTRASLPGSGSVLALAAGGDAIVAVGADGLYGAAGRVALAWRSTDGQDWERATVGGADSAALRGVLAVDHADGADRPRFVAVGSASSGLRAAAWTSSDGKAWTARPGGPEMTNYGQRIAMAALAQDAAGFVAVGGRDSAGNGSPVVWTSRDGLSWARVPDAPSFGGGEMTGAVAGAAGWIAIGSLGWPDNLVATGWTGPPGP